MATIKSTEEKAKAYDEAIERAKDYKNDTIHRPLKVGENIMDYIFPELKESEDERIRKELIDFLEYYRLNNVLDSKTIFLLTDSVAWLEKQGEQKPADKVEPKFKTGDWISGYYTNYKVLSVNNDGYVVEDVDGNKINILFENEKFHHLWTIQDAKDGDVLATLDYILVFKEFLKNDGSVSYCHYDFGAGNPQFFWLEDKNWYFGKEAIIHPATKEQRDLLFQKMKEAGYEWDAEKKELKKIEQKPAWSEEDYIEIKRITGLLEGWASTFEKTFYEKECKRGVAWLKNLKDRVLPQSKQVWSEEDKDIWLEIKSLIDSLISEGENANYREYDLQKMWDWLDTIWQKDRIQTQPKQKWNGTEIAPPIDSDVCG